MGAPAYDRLTFLDSSFLLLETPQAPLHVASTLTFEAGPLRKPDGGIDAEAVKAHVAGELHCIPRYRQKLAWIPFTQRPVWVPLIDNMGLGIALMSYDGKLCWGFNADFDLLPDLSSFVRATRDSFDELRRLASGAVGSVGALAAAERTDGGSGEGKGVRPPVGLEPQLQLVSKS